MLPLSKDTSIHKNSLAIKLVDNNNLSQQLDTIPKKTSTLSDQPVIPKQPIIRQHDSEKPISGQAAVSDLQHITLDQTSNSFHIMITISKTGQVKIFFVGVC